MSKRILTDVQIIEIANSYANDCDAVNMTYLASFYHVSSSTISKVLHYAISNCIIKETVATLIAQKAIRHDTARRELFKHPKSTKVADLYNILLSSYKQKTNKIISIDDINLKYAELKFQLEIFDDVYSSSDDYPFTKEELIKKIDSIEREIDRLKGHRK